MRRVLMLLLVAAWLLPGAGPAAAQATSDQLNKLSLEALTAPAPGGNPGPSHYRPSYARSYHRSFSRPSYATPAHRSYRYAARSPTHYARARFATASRIRHVSYRRASYTVHNARPATLYHRRTRYSR